MLYALLILVIAALLSLSLYLVLEGSAAKKHLAYFREEIEAERGKHAAEIEGLNAAHAKVVGLLKTKHAREVDAKRVVYASEIGQLKGELKKLERFQHIPDILERVKGFKEEIAMKLVSAERQAESILANAQSEADEAVLVAHREVEKLKQRAATRDEESRRTTEVDAMRTKEALRVAETRAAIVVAEALESAREIASHARKEAKEKTKKVDATLAHASSYAMEIRAKAEEAAKKIGGDAYEAFRRKEFYEAAAEAMENAVTGYGRTYLVPASHVLDELADDYGFHKAGERLKAARNRSKIMQAAGLAAACNYPEGWKREYAINFVLGAFNGKVDSILARLKPANQGRMVQEIKDAFALANHNGEVFKGARIHPEFLDARLEELKWGVAVQRLKEKEREEQRAIRERMRDEERARKEYEKAAKQAEKEEETLAKAVERARLDYEAANAEDRAKYEARLAELAGRLKDAEEKNRRAKSMAEQTKRGHVYVISNVGSFGEGVFKIGLTRRIDPNDRVKELGDASVPFSFDVHAMIRSDDAPALETALHHRFVQSQVNKVNRRKEFFRLDLREIRETVEGMDLDVKWTMTAEAVQYRETMALERAMQQDEGARQRWLQGQLKFSAADAIEEELQGDEEMTLVGDEA